MNTIKINLGSDVEYVNLYPTGDFHIGSKFHLKKLLQTHINLINDDPNGFIILNGDLINNAIRHSVSDIYEETLSPEETLDILYELLLPVKHKILGVVSGK